MINGEVFMKYSIYLIAFITLVASNGMHAEINVHPIERGPFEVAFVNKTTDQVNIFIRTANFDQEREREYVHFKDGKWVYSNVPGPLESLIAPGFFSNVVAPASTYTTKFQHAPTLITVKTGGAEASKSVPGSFDLKSVIVTEDNTGLIINFQ